jgi:hypothetical protein
VTNDEPSGYRTCILPARSGQNVLSHGRKSPK